MTRRLSAHAGEWFAIGLERPKFAVNVGTLWRSAVCLDANYIFTVGGRYYRQPSDTVNSSRHVPHFDYPDWDAFLAARPHAAPIVGVELVSGARALETYQHHRCAIYLLGPEDGSLSGRALDACDEVIRFDSAYCLNVAVAGSIVMYDRHQKGVVHSRRAEKRAAARRTGALA